MLGRSYRLVQVVSSGVLAGDEGGDMVLAGAAVCGRGEVRGRWWWGNEWADAPSLSKPAPPPAASLRLSPLLLLLPCPSLEPRMATLFKLNPLDSFSPAASRPSLPTSTPTFASNYQQITSFDYRSSTSPRMATRSWIPSSEP
jgi:hypothetical protein